MKSNAEIKQHKGLDVVRYSEIAGTKGLAGERDVGHTRLIVKPASGPALKPSWNPLGWQGSCASRGAVEGRMGSGGHIWSWSRLCDFNKKASVKNQWSISFQITPTQMLWHSGFSWSCWVHFQGCELWPVAHEEDSPPDWQPVRITPLSSLLTPWHETDLNVTKDY